MALLPSDRVEESPPFKFSAEDIVGSYSVKRSMSCRAVHIEVAFSLTTDSFNNAYIRFVSIRGKVNVLRADCGTNFIDAEREIRHELDGIDNNKVRAHLMKNACEFKFNVPSASHAVRSQLDDECLHTFICAAAAIINSRPLSVYNLADHDNFLTMKPSGVMSSPGNFTKDDSYSRKRYGRIHYLSNQFWLKWRSEYLQNIQLQKKSGINFVLIYKWVILYY